MLRKSLLRNLIILTLLCSCSLAPFSPTNSARSLGKGQMQAEAGRANDSYFMRYGLGLSQNLDIGFVTEFGSISTTAIFAKYALRNNPLGFSWGLEGGYGSSDDTQFYYLGSTASFAFSEYLEVFLNGRFNHADTEDSNVKAGDNNGSLIILEQDLNYFQIAYGMNLWLSSKWGLSFFNTHFRGDDIDTTKDANFGAAFLYRL